MSMVQNLDTPSSFQPCVLYHIFCLPRVEFFSGLALWPSAAELGIVSAHFLFEIAS